jgi:hypothetical protein
MRWTLSKNASSQKPHQWSQRSLIDWLIDLCLICIYLRSFVLSLS